MVPASMFRWPAEPDPIKALCAPTAVISNIIMLNEREGGVGIDQDKIYFVTVGHRDFHILIVVPGGFPKGTNLFGSMGKGADEPGHTEYVEGPYRGIMNQIVDGLGALSPPDADPADVARAIVRVIETPFGQRP
ncbi:hypothetical protein PV04_03912 [Phialophora macrospora]|uniref:Uncharacterized protein n=1 Tax=Phialophora macrospora TaxID=1851006 RepID=A0A0D2FIP7_9EURO|nr:hypothetical protein PV04_03912 [Phialophora macrospora]